MRLHCFILDTVSGAVRARRNETNVRFMALAWSPADERGQWLALAQDPSGVLLVTPDLAAGCLGAAWRPGTR